MNLRIQTHIDVQFFHLPPVPCKQVSELPFIALCGCSDKRSAKMITLLIDHRLMPAKLQHSRCFHAADAAADNRNFLRMRSSHDMMLVFLHGLRIHCASCQMQRIA